MLLLLFLFAVVIAIAARHIAEALMASWLVIRLNGLQSKKQAIQFYNILLLKYFAISYAKFWKGWITTDGITRSGTRDALKCTRTRKR